LVQRNAVRYRSCSKAIRPHDHVENLLWLKLPKRRLPAEVGGQKVNVSEENPRYLVETEKGVKYAAHGLWARK
jgi:hypothetical protein